MLIYRKFKGKWDGEKFNFPVGQEKVLHKGKVARAMGGGGSSGSDKVVATGPWQQQVPYINGLFQQAAGLYNQGAPQYPTGPLTAGVNPTLQASRDASNQEIGANLVGNNQLEQSLMGTVAGATSNPVSQVAGQVAPNIAGGINNLIQGNNAVQDVGMSLVPNIQNAVGQATNASYNPVSAPTTQFGAIDGTGALNTALNSNGINPYTDQIVDAALRSSNQQFQTGVLPGIRTQAGQAGQPGGTRQGIAEGLAARDLVSQQGDIIAKLYGQAFDVGSQDRNAALGLLSNAQGTDVQSNLTTQALNQQGRQNQIGQALQGASLGRDLLTSGTDLSQQARSTGTAQAGNLLTSGNNAAMQQYFQSLGLIPQIQAGNLSQLGYQNQLGLQEYGMDQANIDAEMERYFYNMLAPYNALSQYQSFISGGYGSSLPGTGSPQNSIIPLGSNVTNPQNAITPYGGVPPTQPFKSNVLGGNMMRNLIMQAVSEGSPGYYQYQNP